MRNRPSCATKRIELNVTPECVDVANLNEARVASSAGIIACNHQRSVYNAQIHCRAPDAKGESGHPSPGHGALELQSYLHN